MNQNDMIFQQFRPDWRDLVCIYSFVLGVSLVLMGIVFILEKH